MHYVEDSDRCGPEGDAEDGFPDASVVWCVDVSAVVFNLL